ncbi:hypothetical protein HPB49_003080 [Dermacentor silvarum]|uniref:Uncharacterized protein n=1 Tax=Dermacentor silvarum TaxID=543639 RepID=A0ACB8D296_DERSI|nr:hypothetical protein HPB49_003080 [Dermacentor silvarum]
MLLKFLNLDCLQIDEPELSLTRHRYFDVSYDLVGYRQLVTDALNFVNERNDSATLAAEIVDLEQQLAEGMDGTSGWLPESAQFEVVTLEELQAADNVSLRSHGHDLMRCEGWALEAVHSVKVSTVTN